MAPETMFHFGNETMAHSGNETVGPVTTAPTKETTPPKTSGAGEIRTAAAVIAMSFALSLII
jgi:hypothetical protein